jgi:hypothetical protein
MRPHWFEAAETFRGRPHPNVRAAIPATSIEKPKPFGEPVIGVGSRLIDLSGMPHSSG